MACAARAPLKTWAVKQLRSSRRSSTLGPKCESGHHNPPMTTLTFPLAGRWCSLSTLLPQLDLFHVYVFQLCRSLLQQRFTLPSWVGEEAHWARQGSTPRPGRRACAPQPRLPSYKCCPQQALAKRLTRTWNRSKQWVRGQLHPPTRGSDRGWPRTKMCARPWWLGASQNRFSANHQRPKTP